MPRPSRLLLLIVSFALFGLGLAGLARAGKLVIPDLSGVWDLQGTFEFRCDIPNFPNQPPEPIAFRLLITQSGASLTGVFDPGGAPPGQDVPPLRFVGTIAEDGGVAIRIEGQSLPITLTGLATGTQLTLRLAAEYPPGVPCTFGGPFTGVIRQAGPAPTPTPTPTPLSTPTPIPIPLPTIVPRAPNITLIDLPITDARAVVCTEQTLTAGVQQAVNGPRGLTRTVAFCRKVEEEVAQTVNALVNRTDTTVDQNTETGVTRVAVAGRTFTVWPLGVAQEIRTGPTRAQAAGGVTVDPVTGTATLISPGGIQIRVMGVPSDLQAFLQLLGATAAQASPGQFLLTTSTPGLQLVARPSFEVSGGGGPSGVAVNPDGTRTLTYPTGERQLIFPVFADVPGFLATARAFPGVTQVSANLDGTVTATAGAQTVRVRPDLSLVGGSPAATKRLFLDESGSPAFDLGDGRRQRFTIAP